MEISLFHLSIWIDPVMARHSKLWILMPLPLLAGCFAALSERTQLELTGQYGELVKREEAAISSGKDLSSDKLFSLCNGYARIKNYEKLLECADQLDARMSNGDRKIHLLSTRMGEPTDMGAASGAYSDGVSYPSMLRAEAFIDLGKYDRALAEANKAVGLCDQVQSTVLGYEREECFITGLGLKGLAASFHADRSDASRAIEQLNALALGIFQYPMKSQMRKLALAKIYVSLGDYQEALVHLADEWGGLRAIGRSLRGSGSKSTNMFAFHELPLHYLRGKCQLELGRVAEGKATFEELLSYPQLEQNGEIHWMLLFDLGRIAEKEGKTASAIESYRKAVEIVERQRSTINTEASKIGFVGDKQAIYRQLVAALYAGQDYSAAFEYVERAKSRALVDMLAAKQDFAVSSGNADQVKALLAMAGSAEVNARAQDASPDKAQTRSLVISARQQLREQAPELASLVNVSSLSTSEIQALLPHDEALVEYYHNAPDFLAFFVTRSSVRAVRLDERGLLDDVRAFRTRLEAAGGSAPLDLARKLHDRLIAPVVSAADRKKLIVVAHGPLHYLPFNALHDGSQYIVEKFSVRLLPSASVLKYLKDQAIAKAGSILAFGNPDLGDPRFDLHYAQEEAVAVTRGRPQSKALLRKEASESAFRQYGRGFRYVHFATHGEFNADAPLKSALLLAKDATSDGLLTVDKLYSLRLDADLVTLSACETGLGKVASGDDVVGLTRGFLYAGSRSIVASLWKVDDLATSYLMTRFYDNIKDGDKREALRQAQLATLKKYPHPYFWAAFQLTGSAN